jgi:malate dehydrogenase (oxaloacetate-decarboxylating)
MPWMREEALRYHREHRGKIAVVPKAPLRSQDDLSLAYTPGVAEPCKAIARDPELAFEYTARGNLVAIVTDGSAVLGLGDIGPEASLPVMEGKAVLFKMFGGVDAFPVLVRSHDPDEIAHVVELIEPGLGGVNIEDIASPRCFAVERRLKERLDIPVFNDDQHGTAIVVGAAFLNALLVTGRTPAATRVVINGAGAAGIAVARMLLGLGVEDIVLCDRQGAIYEGREGLNEEKAAIAAMTNRERRRGDLAAMLRGAHCVIGLSVAGAITMDMLRGMEKDSIVFALANPVPEIWPVQALEVGALVVGTGRSDFPNQINNVLGFPGVFRGALDVRARAITEGMKAAAARAIAALVGDDLRPDHILPPPLDLRVGAVVAEAVARAAVEEGVARRPRDPAEVRQEAEAAIRRAHELWAEGGRGQ